MSDGVASTVLAALRADAFLRRRATHAALSGPDARETLVERLPSLTA
jgi:hypothetical protein